MLKGLNKRNIILKAVGLGLLLLLVNIVCNQFFFRLDLTEEGRFTVTDAGKNLLTNLEDDVTVKIFLDGAFPAGIQRLQAASQDMLEELKAQSKGNIEYYFEDPLEGLDNKAREQVMTQLAQKGIQPRRLVENEDGFSEKVFYPAALVYYKGREMPVILLDEQLNRGPQETINNSIAALEYKFLNAIQKLARNTPDRVAFLEGHGELSESSVESWAADLDAHYQLHRVNLTGKSSLANKYDLVVIAKPRLPFSEADKFKIDQYVMNGGKVLWLVENLSANLDSLQTTGGQYLALDYGLKLDDLLFKYGVRLNQNLIQDLQCTSIPLTVGVDASGKATQFENFPWLYYPIIGRSNQNHPVSKNIGPVLTRFAGSLDTVRAKGIKKTILLESSDFCKSVFSPANVDLRITRQRPEPAQFTKKNLAVAVALEGSFTSNFKNRLAFSTKEMIDTLDDVSFKEVGSPTKMIVISDGDMAENDFDKRTGRANPLGYYRFTGETFANKEFLHNAVEWLLDDKGIIAAKSKEVQMRLIDGIKAKEEKTFWTWLNILLPMLLVILGSVLFNFSRKRKYSR